MIHMENLHTGELTCLTGNEYPVFLRRCELEKINESKLTTISQTGRCR